MQEGETGREDKTVLAGGQGKEEGVHCLLTSSCLTLLAQLPHNVLIVQVGGLDARYPVLDISPLRLEVLQFDSALVPGLLTALPRHLSTHVTKHLQTDISQISMTFNNSLLEKIFKIVFKTVKLTPS